MYYLLTTQFRLLTTRKRRRPWKTLREKEKMLVTSIFSFPLSVFYSNREIVILSMFHLSSANAYNLVMPKILSFGKGLNFTLATFTDSVDQDKPALSMRSDLDRHCASINQVKISNKFVHVLYFFFYPINLHLTFCYRLQGK